jgi:hypothetical protein
VTVVALLFGERVVLGHPAQVAEDVGPAASAVRQDRPDLLVAQPDVLQVTAPAPSSPTGHFSRSTTLPKIRAWITRSGRALPHPPSPEHLVPEAGYSPDFLQFAVQIVHNGYIVITSKHDKARRPVQTGKFGGLR